MNFFNKIEDLINKLLTRLGAMLYLRLSKLIPSKLKQTWSVLKERISSKIPKIVPKEIPKIVLAAVLMTITKVKAKLVVWDIKGKITKAIQEAKSKNQGKGAHRFKTLFMTPVLIIAKWLNGLTTAQSLMLMTLTGASVLAGINMIFSGHRLVKQNFPSRAPASVEEVLEYDRPIYYKQEQRHLEFTNVRLPVYIAEVNELRSVDIDFTITLTNRQSRLDLAKLEFQLRDHLILQIEPVTASFPLEDEGKEIIKQKLWMEIDDFLIARKIEGSVADLKITYILAN